MFCDGCGLALQNGAQFCPRCGKRAVLAESASAPSQSNTLPQAEKVADANTNMRERELGEQLEVRVEPEAGGIVDDGSSPPPSETSEPSGSVLFASVAPVTPDPKSPKRFANTGSITLGVFALICLVLGAVQGFIPIFLIVGFAFGGLAWLCAVRWPLSAGVHAAVLVASLLLAVLVGVTLDQDSFGPRYRYLSQGSVQYRVDERAGRTDRLGAGGWYPVAYDSEAKEINALDTIFTVSLTKGYWEPALAGGNICFLITNTSGYIVDRITIQIQTQGKSDAKAGNDSAAAVDQQVILKSLGGGLISPGQNSLVCASSPRDLSADETWSYTDVHVYGWKR